MKFLNPSTCNFTKKIGTLSKKRITSISKSCGFEKRSGKVKATDLIISFMIMMGNGTKSYWAWAHTVTPLIGKTISKQALFKRMNPSWVSTVKALLIEVMSVRVKHQVAPQLFTSFKNVWLQDSTSLHLSDIMKDIFKGNISRGEQKSIAKINVVMNVISGSCAVMDLIGYNISEQALGAGISKIAQSGDLIIRDLGYFVYDVFRDLNQRGIYFLSKLNPGANIYCVKTAKQLNLSQLLKNKQWIDMEVLCSKKNPLKFG